jgi:hypothetical protein
MLPTVELGIIVLLPSKEPATSCVTGSGFLSVRMVAGHWEPAGSEQLVIAEADTYRMHNS